VVVLGLSTLLDRGLLCIQGSSPFFVLTLCLIQRRLSFRDQSLAFGLSIGPLIAVCCQATILPLSSDTSVAIAPSELVRLRRRSDRGWRDDCLAGLAIDVVVGFVGLG
jgi:hypothetical protein